MDRYFDVEQKLAKWESTLLKELDIDALRRRNPTAHKWKALFRSVKLRECSLWRTHDLLIQSFALHQQKHGIGARILLRAAFETLAVLIRINQIIGKVLDGSLNFNRFNEDTSALLLGSKNDQTPIRSINITTILTHCDKRYPGIAEVYAKLCETAHPNFEGLSFGYARTERQAFEITFSNRWMEMYGEAHLDLMRLCITTFEYEYDVIWQKRFQKLELWVEANDPKLEAAKPT